jgi:hypothetical protein
MKSRGILGGIAVVLLGVAVWYGLLSHQTPGGQPPLTEMDPQTLESLKAEFNQASGEFRVILLLSPT